MNDGGATVEGEAPRVQAPAGRGRARLTGTRLFAYALAGLAGTGVLLMWFWPQPMAAMTCRPPLRGASIEHVGRCDYGVKVSASSQDLQMGLHALWTIDGRVGGVLEKWSSREGDKQPWLKLEWTEPVPIGRVVIHHGSEREGPGHAVRDFDILVNGGLGWQTVAQVRNNSEAITSHAFAPRAASALKLQVLKGDDAYGCAWIYEIEVHAS
jgi:F5/8 type C domain